MDFHSSQRTTIQSAPALAAFARESFPNAADRIKRSSPLATPAVGKSSADSKASDVSMANSPG